MTAHTYPPRKIDLHPHDPISLIPLLKSYLPHSLPILGTIHTSPPSTYRIYTTFSTLPPRPHPSAINTSSLAPSSTPIPASTNPTSTSTSNTNATADPTPTPHSRPTSNSDPIAHNTTYPPFVILTTHLPPNSSQARIFCSAESYPSRDAGDEAELVDLVVRCIWSLRDILEGQQGGAVEEQEEQEEKEEKGFENTEENRFESKGDFERKEGKMGDSARGGKEGMGNDGRAGQGSEVGERVDDTKWLGLGLSLVGGVHERWCAGIARASGKDAGTGVGWCDICYQRDLGGGSDESGEGDSNRDGSGMNEGGGDDAGIRKEGLMVDTAIEADAELIQSTRDIRQPIEYYLSRLSQTTVIRPITPPHTPKQPAVAWIMSSASGDLSSLFVVEEYRRRGLAKWVIQERLKRIKEEGDGGACGYVWVVRGNKGSESLFKAMGWVKGWGVQWCHIAKGLEEGSLGRLMAKLRVLEARDQVVSEDVK